MRAMGSYSLDYVGPQSRLGRIRRGWTALVGVLSGGEPAAGDDGKILIVNAFTGRVLGEVVVPFGDDGSIRALLDEDLFTLTPEEFAQRWIVDPPHDAG